MAFYSAFTLGYVVTSAFWLECTLVTVLMQGETPLRIIGLYACTCNFPIARITYRLQGGKFFTLFAKRKLSRSW